MTAREKAQAAARKAGMEPKDQGPTIKDVLASKDGKKAATDLIVAAEREALDLYTEQIAGKKPHPSHDTEKVRAHLIRWAAGDKNWSYDEHKGNGKTNTNADAPRGNDTKGDAEMKKNGTKKDAVKKAGAKKVEQKAAKANGGESRLKGKSGKTRVAWFRDAFLSNKKAKHSDAKILKDAIHEFGEGNVGTGPFTVSAQRAKRTADAKAGKRGLTKADLPFEKYGD